MTPHSPELFYTAIAALTPATTLRMAAVIAGLAITVIGLVLWYRRGPDDQKVSTLRRFVLPVAVSITGTMLAAAGVTFPFVPSSSTQAVDWVEDSPNTPPTLTAPVMAPSDSAESKSAAGVTQRAVVSSPAERRKGPIVLTDGYAVDLDSRDTDWNITQAEFVHFEENLDLRLFTLLDVHKAIAETTPSAGYFDCANSNDHQTEIAHDKFSEGDAFCVETDEHRWARVVITAKETDSTYSTRVTMNVVVWEK
jgi:hypothetical protein